MAEEEVKKEEAINMKEIAPKEPPRDLTKERNDRCIPIAQKILPILVKAPIVLDANKLHGDVFNQYAGMYSELAKIFVDEKVRMSDVHYIFQLVNQCGIILENITKQSLNKAVQNLMVSYWNKPEEEVTIGEVHERMLVKEKKV